MNRMIDLMNNWLIELLIDWLIDCFNVTCKKKRPKVPVLLLISGLNTNTQEEGEDKKMILEHRPTKKT